MSYKKNLQQEEFKLFFLFIYFLKLQQFLLQLLEQKSPLLTLYTTFKDTVNKNFNCSPILIFKIIFSKKIFFDIFMEQTLLSVCAWFGHMSLNYNFTLFLYVPRYDMQWIIQYCYLLWGLNTYAKYKIYEGLYIHLQWTTVYVSEMLKVLELNRAIFY